MNFDSITKKILELEKKDYKIRAELIKKGTLSNGYNNEMQVLHHNNA